MNLSATFKADKRKKTKQRREEYTMRRSVAATSAIQKCTTTKINEPSKQQAENKKKKINMTAILATTNNLDIMTIMDHIFSANKNKQTTKQQTTKSSRPERVLVIR